MGFVSYKIKFAILGAMVVPCFGRLALHGTGSEHDLYRYFVPILVGGLAGYFIGLMKDKWVVKNEELETTNEFLKQEIDERKRAKDVVRESERKYRNIYDNAQIGLFRSRLEDGKMVMANNRMAEIFGYKDAEECVSNYVAAEHWVYPEVRDKLVETMREHGKVTKFEAPIRKDDGSIIWIQFSGTLSSEEDYFEGVVADITERKQAEEALRDSEERYRTLMDNLPVAVYRNTPGPKGEFLMANPAFCKMFGFKNEEEVKRVAPADIYVNPDERKQFSDNLMKRGVVENDERTLLKRDGTPVHASITSRVVYGQDGEASHFDSILLDVTDRKRAEEALRKSDKRLKGIFESIPSPIIVYNTEGHPLYLNPAFTKLFLWSLDELKGRRIQFVPDDQKELTAEKIGEVYKTGKVVSYETKRLTKQGDAVDVIVSGAFVTGPDGEPMEMVAILTDIRGLKQAEEALRESEQKYRTVLESNPDPVVFYDMDGRVIYLNPAFTRVFGWSLEEQIGKKIDGFVPEKNMPETMDMINKVTVSGESFSGIETRRYTKEGNILDISISGSCYRDHEGNVAASVINLRDITEKKRLEDQLQKARKMEAMGLMAGGVAHDLNNILSGIVSYPELLLVELPEESPLRKPIKTIQESGLRAADVVEDLMTIARGAATGKDALNINTIVTGYLGSAEHRRLEKTHALIDFKTELAPDLLNISGSLTHINKSLMNLVTNASEAIEGAGTVTISTVNRYIDEPLKGHEDVRTGEYVVLSVSDDGSGIAPKDLERIFEPFYTKKVMGRSGTGLGLAVVWNTVQDHKGYINVESSENATAFELYFSVTREKVVAEGEEAPLEDYLGHGEKILVVDDEERQREIADGILTWLGYDAETVSNGEEAIEYVKEHPVDLIVLDMVMPKGINGRETYEEIIKIRPGQKAVIASGYARTKEVDIAQQLGAGKYIKKPYTLAKVGLAVKEELEK